MSAGGRPTKFNPEVVEKFLRLAEGGHYFNFACAACGLGKSTVKRWLARGKRTGKADEPFREFRAAYYEKRSAALLDIERNVISEAKANAEIGLKVLAVLARQRWSAQSNRLQQLEKKVKELEARQIGS
jgi:uncharacterized protein YhaN